MVLIAQKFLLLFKYIFNYINKLILFLFRNFNFLPSSQYNGRTKKIFMG